MRTDRVLDTAGAAFPPTAAAAYPRDSQNSRSSVQIRVSAPLPTREMARFGLLVTATSLGSRV
jgi:hypothetical protein